MKKLLWFGLALTLSLSAQAQFSRPDQAIKYRQSAMYVMNTHLGRLGAMANGRVPFDAKLAQENAAVLESLSKLPWSAFDPGTDLGDTQAKAEIWSQQTKFKAAADAMVSEVTKLSAAAKTGRLEDVKSAFSAVAKSCKACHDNYREEK